MSDSTIFGTCSDCGFRYFTYAGHLIPCPLCRITALEQALTELIPLVPLLSLNSGGLVWLEDTKLKRIAAMAKAKAALERKL